MASLTPTRRPKRFLPHPHRVKRERLQRILYWAAYLAPEQQALVHEVYVAGKLPRQIARERGQSVQSVRYQLRKLMQRMQQPRFRFVARRLDLLPVQMHTTAKLVVLHGLSQAETARRTRLSLHRVRECMKTIDTLMRCVG